jgi:polyphosphate kinase
MGNTTGVKMPAVPAGGNGAAVELAPSGIDAEALELKKVRKRRKGRKMKDAADDRVGDLVKLKTQDYLQLMMPLHVELLKMQNWVKEQRLRIVVIFEGRDAAGKGGTIKRFIEHVNPRGCRVVALDKPTDEERGQWYFQRYVAHLPTAGEIVLFDRSWYNRSGVERVMGFCSPEEVQEFLRTVPEFERMLIRSGIRLYKFYFSVSKKEQLRRFSKRTHDPLKQWKLSPVDREGQDKWDEYTTAKEDMLRYTSTLDCPWTIVKSDDKKRARVNAIRHFLSGFDYPKANGGLLTVDRRIVRAPSSELDVTD